MTVSNTPRCLVAGAALIAVFVLATAPLSAQQPSGSPGSPGATQTLSWLFLVPAIRKVGGHGSWNPPEIVAVLEADVPSRRGLARFLPARVSRRAEGLSVRPALTPDRELYSPSLQVNGLLVIPSDVDFLKSGYEVRVILIGEVEPEAGEEIY